MRRMKTRDIRGRYWGWMVKAEIVKQKTQAAQVRNPQEIIFENVFCGKGIPDSAPLQDLRKTK